MKYLKQVLNKQFVKVYYIEFPNRIRGFLSEIHCLPVACHLSPIAWCRMPSQLEGLLPINPAGLPR